MPARNRKGRFTKGGHKARTRTRTITKTKYRTRSGGHRKARRRHHGGGGMNLVTLGVAGAALAYLTGKHGPSFVTENVAKIPGAKTFGTAATAGLACLAADRFVKRNKWLRAAGIVGLVLGATQLGSQGADFKWVGDGEGFIGDIEGDDDIGELDVGDEGEG